MKDLSVVILLLGLIFFAYQYDSIVCGIGAALLGMLVFMAILD